jgi:hypothetical protein
MRANLFAPIRTVARHGKQRVTAAGIQSLPSNFQTVEAVKTVSPRTLKSPRMNTSERVRRTNSGVT